MAKLGEFTHETTEPKLVPATIFEPVKEPVAAPAMEPMEPIRWITAPEREPVAVPVKQPVTTAPGRLL